MNWKGIIAIILIVATAVEVVIIAFTGTTTPQTTQNNTVTPSTTPVVFEGYATINIAVSNESGIGYLQCVGGNSSQDLSKIINDTKFFQDIISNNQGVYRLSFQSNLSVDEFDSEIIKTQMLLKNYCNSTKAYRLGQIQILDSEINATSSDGITRQTISTDQVNNYFYYQGSMVNALLFPDSKINSTGYANILLTTHDYAIDPTQGDVVIIEQINPYQNIINQLTQPAPTANTNQTNENTTQNQTTTSNSTNTISNQTTNYTQNQTNNNMNSTNTTNSTLK